MLTTVWSMHIPLMQDTMQLRSGRTIPKPTQWPAVRMTAAAVARAAAITNATKVWNLGLLLACAHALEISLAHNE